MPETRNENANPSSFQPALNRHGNKCLPPPSISDSDGNRYRSSPASAPASLKYRQGTLNRNKKRLGMAIIAMIVGRSLLASRFYHNQIVLLCKSPVTVRERPICSHLTPSNSSSILSKESAIPAPNKEFCIIFRPFSPQPPSPPPSMLREIWERYSADPTANRDIR